MRGIPSCIGMMTRIYFKVVLGLLSLSELKFDAFFSPSASLVFRLKRGKIKGVANDSDPITNQALKEARFFFYTEKKGRIKSVESAHPAGKRHQWAGVGLGYPHGSPGTKAMPEPEAATQPNLYDHKWIEGKLV